MTKRPYDDCFVKPEITQAGEFQVFTLKGKDSRGYDFTVRLSAVSEDTVPGNIPETADSDRLEVYFGGDPEEIEKIDGEVEVTLGDAKEPYHVDKTTLVYIPKGTPVKHQVSRKPEQTTWLLSYNLTPKWEAPDQKQEAR